MPEEGASLAAKMGEGGEVVDDTYTPCQQLIRGKKKKKIKGHSPARLHTITCSPCTGLEEDLGLAMVGGPKHKRARGRAGMRNWSLGPGGELEPDPGAGLAPPTPA